MGQVDVEEQQVGDALVALPLEMVFRRPEGVVPQFLHLEDDGLGLVEDGGQVAVREPAVVDRGAFESKIVEVYVPGEQTAEFGDHGRNSCNEPGGFC